MDDNKSMTSGSTANPTSLIGKDIRLPALYGTENFLKTEYIGISEERADRTDTITSRA